jgi:hypothetical protein
MASYKLRAALGSLVFVLLSASAGSVRAAPATPSGAHPRMFMGATSLAAYQKNATTKGTAAYAIVARCQDAIDNAKNYTTRGGSDGDNWPGSAASCAFAWRATGKAEYLTQAIKYWQASLDDDQTIGDKLGCVVGVATDWSKWSGNPPAPPVLITVTHDTGYPIRWYGPDVALTYDWLAGAAGVSDALLAQTRTCLGAWVDWYSKSGYHRDEPGSNYNAGFVIAKALAGVAIGNDGGADGHLWTQTTDELFPNLLVAKGLAGGTTGVGTKAGSMLGGDWGEGWQYGPLSVLEYAIATKALEAQGTSQPEMDAWASALALRLMHGTVPKLDGNWVGGDYDSERVYSSPRSEVVDAVRVAGGDTAANWVTFLAQAQGMKAGTWIYSAIAEARATTPTDFRAQTPAPTRWYLARGTRAVYARTGWDEAAYWTVFSSAPAIVSDHDHFSASNFVFTRGADHLVVDPSRYGEVSTLATNALSVDSAQLTGNYAQSQSGWSQAELAWARGTDDGVYAARSDLTKAFLFTSKPTDVAYAHREWVMLPEGEIVTIDRAHTGGASLGMNVRFHTNTRAGGGLKLDGRLATGTVGGSAIAIHAVTLSSGTPTITQPEVRECSASCDYPCGMCDAARFAVDEYQVKPSGPWAVAIHVIDGLAASETKAIVGAIGDDVYDPSPKQNAGVIGAAIFRGTKQSYVIASSAQDGAAGATMTYGVPGTNAARHVVFDAPEDANGKSTVSAAATNGRCVLTITAATGGAGLTGRPLMFGTSSAADGCKVTESTDVAPGTPPPPSPETGGGGGGGSGCGCRSARTSHDAVVALAALGIAMWWPRRRRGRK